MGRILFGLFAIVGLLIAIALFAPGLIPVAQFKPQIETAASEALGRKVTIGDDLSLQFFPRAAFRVNGLEVANADGFDAAYFMRVDKAEIGVKIAPLLSRSVDVDQFVLIGPDINLSRRARRPRQLDARRANGAVRSTARRRANGR